MFDPVFLDDPNLKSTFAQNESCSSSFAHKLLFWPNFKFLYQILTFGRSNASQIWSKFVELYYFAPVLATVSPGTHADDCGRRCLLHASAIDDPRTPRGRLLIRSRRPSSIPPPLSPSSRLRRARTSSSRRRALRRPTLATPPRFLAPESPPPHPAPLQHLPDLVWTITRPESSCRPPSPLPFVPELRPLR